MGLLTQPKIWFRKRFPSYLEREDVTWIKNFLGADSFCVTCSHGQRLSPARPPNGWNVAVRWTTHSIYLFPSQMVWVGRSALPTAALVKSSTWMNFVASPLLHSSRPQSLKSILGQNGPHFLVNSGVLSCKILYLGIVLTPFLGYLLFFHNIWFKESNYHLWSKSHFSHNYGSILGFDGLTTLLWRRINRVKKVMSPTQLILSDKFLVSYAWETGRSS